MSALATEPQTLTPAEARALTDEIRQTLRVGHDLIARAWVGRAWEALGYDTWDAYCAGEFSEARMVRLGREQRQEIVAELRDAGMSTRAIGQALGVSHTKVQQDLAAGGNNLPPADPAPVTGTDGKTYRRPLPDAFFDAFMDLIKAAERVDRLCADDRFPRNAAQVGAKHRADLLRVQRLVQGALDRFPSEGDE